MKKLKKGLSYISERTGQFRYSDKENIEKWIQPLSEYIPLVKIKRGQPVSVATKKDLEEIEKKLNLDSGKLTNSSNSYITLTNPSKHSHSIGLAYEYSDGISVDNLTPDMIHILGNGKFLIDVDYLIKSHQLNETEIDTISETEYVPSFLNNYSEHIGKPIYCKAGIDGELTIIPEEAYLAYNNVIKIGFITDAWLDNQDNNIKTSSAALEIQIDGDDRGILDATSFEAILGETVTIPENDDVRVFALGQDDDTKFEFKLGYKSPDNDEVKSGFIGLQRLDGKTALIYINSEDKSRHNIEDTAFIEVGKFFGDIIKYELNLRSLKLDNISDFWSKLKEKLNLGINEISYLPEEVNGLVGKPDYKGKDNYEKITEFEITEENGTAYSKIGKFIANQYGGYYDIYISSELKKYFQFHSVQSHGSYYNKGYAVLADIRNPNRQNLIGIYNSGKNKILKGTAAVFLKQGLFRTKKEYEPGVVYYLSNNGKINKIPQEYFNSILKIGSAQTKNQLIIDCYDSRQYPDGDLPVGYMKPSVNGEAEFGFTLMNGKTVLDCEKYSALFKRCKQWFTIDELKVDEYDFDGNGLTDLDKTNNTTAYKAKGFVLPLIQYQKAVTQPNETGYIPAQIKYLPEGVYKEIPREPFIRRVFDSCEDKNGISQIPIIDITPLIVYGPESDVIYYPELETLDIRLFADLRDIPDKKDRQWTEIKSGFHEFNNTEYYGFEWRIKQVQKPSLEYPMGQYVLYTVNSPNDNDTNALGPRYQKTPYSPPETLNGRPLKIFVAKRDYWTRQFDVEALFHNYVKESILDLSGLPWTGTAVSGNAIIKDIKTKVDTNLLYIADKENFENEDSKVGEVVGYIKNLNFTFKTPEAEKDISAIINGSVRFIEPKQTEKIVLDYYKGFLKYAKENSALNDVQNESVANQFKTQLKNDVWNLIPYQLLKDHEDQKIGDKSPHGIENKGYSGNINASKLQGTHIGKPGAILTKNTDEGSSDNTTFGNYRYIIPVLKEDQNTCQYEFVIGNQIIYQYIEKQNNIPHSAKDVKVEKIDEHGNSTFTFNNVENHQIKQSYTIQGGKAFDIIYDFANDNLSFKNIDGTDLKINNQSLGSSSREYKRITTELNDTQFIKDWGVDYNEEDNTDAQKIKDNLKNSALQAVSVLPLAVFKYNNEASNLKRWFGLITERISEAKTIIQEDTENKLGGKIVIKNENFTGDTDTKIEYKFTENEKNSIYEYLNFLTTNNNKSQNVLSSIGLLLEAAKETQQRLLAVEASAFGYDSPTIPGSHKTPENLPDYVTNLPTILGLNRLIKAVCAEVFQDADPIELAKGKKSLHNYSRLDRIDQEVNGKNATTVGKIDETKIHHLDADCSTYPTEQNIKDDKVVITDREEAYDVTKEIVSDGTHFSNDEAIFKNKEDKNQYKTDKQSGLDTVEKKFDGINEAINRIVFKLNTLTEYINGEDNISARPQLIDKIRDNIETIIQELFDEPDYYDDGTLGTPSFAKEKLSRIDAATKRLYDYKLTLENDKNISGNSSNESKMSNIDNEDNYQISKRTFNNKKIKGIAEKGENDNLVSISSTSPEKVEDYKYATIIDILVDLIGKSEDKLLRYNGTTTSESSLDKTNKNNFRLQETILERISQIEKALDAVSTRFRAIEYFEKDNQNLTSDGFSYNGIKNIELNYNEKFTFDKDIEIKQENLGIKINGNSKSFWTEPKDDTKQFEEYLNKSGETHLHNAIYDIAARLLARESESKAIKNALGLRYNINDSNSANIKKNSLSFGTDDAKYSHKNTISSDLSAVLKLLYGIDEFVTDKYNTKPVEFNTDTESNEEFNLSGNALEKLYKELYNLPTRHLKTSNNTVSNALTDFSGDPDHNSNVLYDIDNPEKGHYTLFNDEKVNGTILSNGNRNDFITVEVYGKENHKQIVQNNSNKRTRKNRFQIIEDSIIALRKFVGLSSATNLHKYEGTFAITSGNVHGEKVSVKIPVVK